MDPGNTNSSNDQSQSVFDFNFDFDFNQTLDWIASDDFQVPPHQPVIPTQPPPQNKQHHTLYHYLGPQGPAVDNSWNQQQHNQQQPPLFPDQQQVHSQHLRTSGYEENDERIIYHRLGPILPLAGEFGFVPGQLDQSLLSQPLDLSVPLNGQQFNHRRNGGIGNCAPQFQYPEIREPLMTDAIPGHYQQQLQSELRPRSFGGPQIPRRRPRLPQSQPRPRLFLEPLIADTVPGCRQQQPQPQSQPRPRRSLEPLIADAVSRRHQQQPQHQSQSQPLPPSFFEPQRQISQSRDQQEPIIPEGNPVFSGQVPGECPLQCLECPLRFPSNREMRYHLHSHDPRKEHQCLLPRCNCGFTNVNMLNVHLQGHYGKFRCQICGQYFMNPQGLGAHIQKHE